MSDVDYIKQLLRSDYETERAGEIPYPPLDQVIQEREFCFEDGTVEGQEPFGKKNRDGKQYLRFHSGIKSIYTHRFIVSYALGKWMPREFVVDHVNHDPTDNCPRNLRLTTHAGNAANARTALLSEIVTLSAVKEKVRVPASEPTPAHDGSPGSGCASPETPLAAGAIPEARYTGETKPAKYAGEHGGAWYKTNLETWHLLFKSPFELTR